MRRSFYRYDAVIVGAGPNGLSAGIALARRGARTLILERQPTVGGGTRTSELTLPGFRHDICSAIHPLGVGSPFIRSLPLDRFGLEWIHPDLPLAHPLDGGDAAFLARSVASTAAGLGDDRASYFRTMQPLVSDARRLVPFLLGPIKPDPRALRFARFGLSAVRSANGLARSKFAGDRARALLAGNAAHSFLRLDQPASAGFALTLMVAGHAFGWPFPRGGSQSIADALAGCFQELGGEISTGIDVQALGDLPRSRTYIFDTTPHQLLKIAGDRIGGLYRKQIERYTYGPGVFKIDYALDAPISWTSETCRRAGTVHVGGSLEDIAASELAVLEGRHPLRPFVLVAQHSLFDETRAPAGKHTAWAYCHVPSGSTLDMTAQIEQQIERFAPGFRKHILARHTLNTADFESYNPNFIDGDISAGGNHLRQLVARPAIKWDPYSTSDPDIFLCSASTPPGGGVHGMGGYHAARSVLRRLGTT